MVLFARDSNKNEVISQSKMSVRCDITLPGRRGGWERSYSNDVQKSCLVLEFEFGVFVWLQTNTAISADFEDFCKKNTVWHQPWLRPLPKVKFF